MISDGLGLSISHISSTSLSTPSIQFTLFNVLHVPSIPKNLIFISKFCKTNHVYVEFFPYYFLVKDLSTKKHLFHGSNKLDLYEWPTTTPATSSSSHPPQIYTRIIAFHTLWHNLLGLPSHQIIDLLFCTRLAQVSLKSSNKFYCISCLNAIKVIVYLLDNQL